MSSPYTGPLDRKKMSEKERIGYEAYNSQKARSKRGGLPPPQYSSREFIGWWLENLKTFRGSVPTCGRKDHAKGYSWPNIEMQDMPENSREGLLRNKTNVKMSIKCGQRISIICPKTKQLIAVSSSMRDTADIFGVSQRLVQFLVRGKYKQSKKINFVLEAQ